ncbi:MAG: hypothetical protein MUO87_01575 [Thermoplasmata archaeon]|nr:hypothetical protein [Thermoplasmata archaeon]
MSTVLAIDGSPGRDGNIDAMIRAGTRQGACQARRLSPRGGHGLASHLKDRVC